MCFICLQNWKTFSPVNSALIFSLLNIRPCTPSVMKIPSSEVPLPIKCFLKCLYILTVLKMQPRLLKSKSFHPLSYYLTCPKTKQVCMEMEKLKNTKTPSVNLESQFEAIVSVLLFVSSAIAPFSFIITELPHDKPKKRPVHPAKTQTPADSEDSDQTGRMHRLI